MLQNILATPQIQSVRWKRRLEHAWQKPLLVQASVEVRTPRNVALASQEENLPEEVNRNNLSAVDPPHQTGNSPAGDTKDNNLDKANKENNTPLTSHSNAVVAGDDLISSASLPDPWGLEAAAQQTPLRVKETQGDDDGLQHQ